MNRIDLRSDSLTLPDADMRAAMAAAELGDDVYGEDPTVKRLEARSAELLGQEAALFVPSGTMANLIAHLIHTRPGQTLLLSESSHSLLYEGGNLAAFAGLLSRPIPDTHGKIAAAMAARFVMQIDDPHFSHTTLLTIENTTNRGGGTYYTLEEAQQLAGLCHERGMKIHCDGARLFNGLVAAGCSPAEFGALFDSIYYSLSKGLGCPAGAVLAGSAAFIHQARRYRKMLGGGLRQVGVLAAAGLYALDNGYIEALAEDHRRAATFREALEAEGFVFPQPFPTNIAYLRIDNPMAALQALAAEGVLTLPHDPMHLRVMFHRDITDEGLQRAIETFKRLLKPA